jgi:hypothetical protein
MTEPIKYREYTIREIYQSADGRGNMDYSIKGDCYPHGHVIMRTTLKKVKAFLDTKDNVIA